MFLSGEEKGLCMLTRLKIDLCSNGEASMSEGTVTPLPKDQERRVTFWQNKFNGFLEIYHLNLRCSIKVATAFAARVWREVKELTFTLQSNVTCICSVSDSVNSTSHIESNIFASETHKFHILYWIRYVSDLTWMQLRTTLTSFSSKWGKSEVAKQQTWQQWWSLPMEE